MRQIKNKLQDCLNEIANDYGVLINNLEIEWIDITDINSDESYKVSIVETNKTKFI